jgi:hypothetical protein
MTSFSSNDGRIFKHIAQAISDKRAVVLSGFSGSGYASPQGLREKLTEILEKERKAASPQNIIVVAGATAEGIGLCYEIAKEMGIQTLGIVSELGMRDASTFCDEVIGVPDPTKSWKVLSQNGSSFMVAAARNNGIFYALGGGEVTLSELMEAKRAGIQTMIFPDFEPAMPCDNPAKPPKADPTPVRTWVAANSVQERDA